MATKAQRKRKHARRRAHAVRPTTVVNHGRPGLVGAIKEVLDVDLYPHQERVLEEVLGPTPGRALCPACGYSQRVRKDGTIGSHDVRLRVPGVKLQCEGTGRTVQ